MPPAYFMADFLKPVLGLMHPEENVAVFMSPPTDPLSFSYPRRRLAFQGHNWRLIIELQSNRSAYEIKDGLQPFAMKIDRMATGKKTQRRLNIAQPHPILDSEFRAFADDGNAYTEAQAKFILNSMQVDAIMKPAPAKPPFSGAKRLSEMGNSEPFLRLTSHMIKNGRIEAHQDHVYVAQPFRMDLGVHVRPVKTFSAIAQGYLVRELPSDEWVLPYQPSVTQTTATPAPPAVPKNPHGYETTEGLRRRLARSIF
jgi:hypothetical protein